jgi:hypothetical protein
MVVGRTESEVWIKRGLQSREELHAAGWMVVPVEITWSEEGGDDV